MDSSIQQMIENARTINEKIKSYKPSMKVNENCLKEWRNVRTLLNDNHFKEMLEIENISQSEFSFALQAEKDFEYKEIDQWFIIFSDILDRFSYDEIEYKDGVYVPALPFLYFLMDEIEDFAKKRFNIIIEKKVIVSFIEAAQAEVFSILGKLIAIELELYKQSKQFISEEREEKFKEFMRSKFYSKESFLEFYMKYPVVARLVTVRINYLKKNFECLLSRLDEDFLGITNFLGMDQCEKLTLTQIDVSTGDSHKQGNAVAVLHFKEKKLVYKPRNLQIGESFKKFFDWYQSKSNLLDLKIPKGMYHDEYSYQEFIEKESCRHEEDVVQFYTRYGYLVAICYLLY